MNDELLNLIPDDILNLIWKRVRPSIKYNTNHENFNKYYCYRFALINSKQIHYISNLSNLDFYNVKNFNYVKYLIKNDAIMMFDKIITNKLSKKTFAGEQFMFNHKIVFENIKFFNFIDLCHYHAKKMNAHSIKAFLEEIFKTYNFTFLIKKEHKNNYKNTNRSYRWNA
jgi:hypothetical protein